MADDYEDNVSDSSEASAEKQPKKDDTAQTALLPKSFFPKKSLGVGKECKIRQVAVHQDEVEVEYVAHEGGESSSKRDMMDEDMMSADSEDDYY